MLNKTMIKPATARMAKFLLKINTPEASKTFASKSKRAKIKK